MEQKVDELIAKYEAELNGEEHPQRQTKTLLDYLYVLYQIKYDRKEARQKHSELLLKCKSNFYKKHGCSPIYY